MKLTIVNKNADFWDNLSKDAENALYKYGGELYVNNTVPTDKIRVIKGTNGFITPAITGYSKTEEHEPNCGVWDSGSEYENQVNTGLDSLFGSYTALNGLASGNRWDFDYLKGIDLTGIPEEDFTIDNSGDCINNMASSNPLFFLDSEIEYEL